MKKSAFQFSQPLLTKSIFEMRPIENSDSEVSLHIHRNILNIEGKNQAIVELTVQLNKKAEIEKPNAPFICEVTMQSLFSWEDDITGDQTKILLERNASSLLLGYIRPIVAYLTNVSPIGVYNIPFINLADD